MWLLVFSSVSLPFGAMGWWSVSVEFPGLTILFLLNSYTVGTCSMIWIKTLCTPGTCTDI